MKSLEEDYQHSKRSFSNFVQKIQIFQNLLLSVDNNKHIFKFNQI